MRYIIQPSETFYFVDFLLKILQKTRNNCLIIRYIHTICIFEGAAWRMTDKELKHLSRSELIDIIYELQKQNRLADEKASAAQAALSERELHIEKAGSIAEAALQLNGVFDAAQAAADQYLASIRCANADMDKKLADAESQVQSIVQQAGIKAEATVREAQNKADEMIRDAEKKAGQLVADAEQQANEKWEQFSHRAEELLNAHAQLQALFKGMDLK